MKEKEILPILEKKFGITELNEMQKDLMSRYNEPRDIILLAPTGSGKTLAFTLPALKLLSPPKGRLQMLIITPTRELTLQVASVIRELAAGYKVVALYGGHNVEDEKNSLSIVPDIVIATPGRLLDHLQRRNIDILNAGIVVLDEFDKALELGFEKDMKKIFSRLKNLKRIMLTSATQGDVLPEFLKLNTPITYNYLENNNELRKRQRTHKVESDKRDKLESLLHLLKSLESDSDKKGEILRTIVFVNHRESAERVETYLKKNGIDSLLYHGALDQQEREIALAMFNNGSRNVLVATDLAARGLDIEKVGSIVHYHQALTPEAHTHRNGRTARAGEAGDIYMLIGVDEDVKPYVDFDDTYYPDPDENGRRSRSRETIYIGAGKKEKMSRGDIVGFLTKECNVAGSDIGKINLYDHYSLVAIPKEDALRVVEQSKTAKIKGKKCRMSIII